LIRIATSEIGFDTDLTSRFRKEKMGRRTTVKQQRTKDKRKNERHKQQQKMKHKQNSKNEQKTKSKQTGDER
jgi:hypothetical protein